MYNVQLTADRRTLILTTAPHSAAMTYAIALPAWFAPKRSRAQLKQLPDVDLQYDLCGVEATWQPEGNAAGRLAAARRYRCRPRVYPAQRRARRALAATRRRRHADVAHVAQPARHAAARRAAGRRSITSSRPKR